MTIQLAKPALEHLPSYVDALRRGWSPDNVRLEITTRQHLAAIDADPVAFVESLDDPEAKGAPITLPDGTIVPRLPGYSRFIWDGEVAGSIGLRWQEGTSALPSHVLGHIGYAVVPWKRGRGYATQALALMLGEARARGLDYVEITAQPDNIVSQKVITANGGVLVERFWQDPAYGRVEGLRFRVDL
ncbi:putative acetyltransferase [Mesorhizobium soli]|uniref:GNAT family N-acetyltransferase n=1 Tax=Pseudaminobacter soli (ex Li et al. 2025) TaxID=1295366 RepID=UPI0024762D7A|nr:GNAT family N-acetyltransferase [Mesorhizobium soli]MDH6232330.1 putative acetyltransferase [Mesorhizobium soli]